MYKRIILIILAFGFIYGSFNQVNADLERVPYDFKQFQDDVKKHSYGMGTQFICAIETEYFDIPYKTVLAVTEKTTNGVLLRDEKGLYQVKITKENFVLFRDTFITKHCLIFESGFPVKFFKVLTETSTRNMEVSNTPGGPPIDIEFGLNHVIFYAYANTKYKNSNYVLIGLNKEFSPEIETDIDYILGWVEYERNGQKVNLVQWNTNVGVRPKTGPDLDRKPLIFFADEKGEKAAIHYLETGSIPDSTSLVVNINGIKKYNQRIKAADVQINRWLPLYTTQIDNTKLLKLGVLEDASKFKESMDRIITLKEMKIVFIVDATYSMDKVWENFGEILQRTIENFTNYNGGWKNSFGDNITPKIKVYFFDDKIHLLNREWISTTDQVESYSDKINSITVKNSPNVRVNLNGIFENVLNDIKGDDAFIVVIGDAGDESYRGIPISDFPAYKKFQANYPENFVPAMGVRYNSHPRWKKTDNQTWHDNYMAAYEEFGKTFDLMLKDVRPTFNVDVVSGQISSSIMSELKKLTDQLINISSGKKVDLDEQDYGTFFTPGFIRKYADLDLKGGEGTWFTESYVIGHDTNGNELFNKDVLISEMVIKKLARACQKFVDQRNMNNLKYLFKKSIAAFFEIDFEEVSDQFLEKITLRDLWAMVVGDEKIAMQLAPDLFKADISLKYIFDNLDSYKDLLLNNASHVLNNIYRHLNSPYPGRYTALTDLNKLTKYDYYWMDVNEINLFQNISLIQN